MVRKKRRPGVFVKGAGNGRKSTGELLPVEPADAHQNDPQQAAVAELPLVKLYFTTDDGREKKIVGVERPYTKFFFLALTSDETRSLGERRTTTHIRTIFCVTLHDDVGSVQTQ